MPKPGDCALAFEHRFAAAIADPGIVSIGRTWLEQFPSEAVALYHAGEKAQFDQVTQQAMSDPGAQSARQAWEFRARPYGVTGYSAVLDEVVKYDIPQAARFY